MVCMRRVILAGLLAAVGCQNNTIELLDDDGTGPAGSSSDGSGDGTADGRPTTTEPMMTTMTTSADTGVPSTIEDGWWLMAVDTPLSPGLPLQFLVEVVQVAPGSYNLAWQSLSLDPGSTTAPRMPVGDVRTVGGLALGGGAPLQFYSGVAAIPGAANPITGSDMTIDIYFDGMEIGDPYCGVVSGDVKEPLQTSLAGSTFATTRLTATDPASLPVDFPVACP